MLFADADVTVKDIGRGYQSLIVSGLIILAMIGVAIWWLRRNS